MTEQEPCLSGQGDGGYPSDCELTQALLARSLDAGQPMPRSEEWRPGLAPGRAGAAAAA